MTPHPKPRSPRRLPTITFVCELARGHRELSLDVRIERARQLLPRSCGLRLVSASIRPDPETAVTQGTEP